MDWRKKEYWIALVLVLSTGIYGFVVRHQRVAATGVVALQDIPLVIDDWQGEDFSFTADVLDVLKADRTLNRRYVNSNGDEVWLFIGYWKDQKYGAQPHSPLHCLPGSGWNITRNELIRVPLGSNGHTRESQYQVNFAVIANQQLQQRMMYWYQTRSGRLPKELQVKLDLARNALLRRPTDVAFIRLIEPVDGSESPSGDALMAFWAAAAQPVQQQLPFNDQ